MFEKAETNNRTGVKSPRFVSDKPVIDIGLNRPCRRLRSSFYTAMPCRPLIYSILKFYVSTG